MTLQDVSDAARLSDLNEFTGNYAPLQGGEFNDTFVLDCGKDKAVLRVARYKEVANLHREANALGLLNLAQVPRLIHYDEKQRINGRPWIMESFVRGKNTSKLNLAQFCNLGQLLAQVHKVRSPKLVTIDYWAAFLQDYQPFGSEQFLLSHPDVKLKGLINRGRKYFELQAPTNSALSLTHGDISLGNILVNYDSVSLIDWEYARYRHPMADFSAMYYEDMEYNNGNWRIHIRPEERKALFKGYTATGGIIDEGKIKIWINFDKLGNCLYLYWKIHQSGHETKPRQLAQYQLDLNALIASLELDLY
jgi:aminoglycoside phosphotransferase (APT) family kinase protein